MGNDPVNDSDPTGNRPTDCGEQGKDCGGESLDKQLSDYSIANSGLSDAQKMNVILAAGLVGMKFVDSTSTGGSPTKAFKKAEGDVNLTIVGKGNTAWSGNCSLNWDFTGQIFCNSVPTVQNFILELGHVFDVHYHDVVRGDLANAYDPIGWEKGYAGYQCDSLPCLEHPLADDGYGTRGRTEDFADMFLNWVLDGNKNYPLNGFTTDAMGIARRNYMSISSGDPKYPTGMPMWLSQMGLR